MQAGIVYTYIQSLPDRQLRAQKAEGDLDLRIGQVADWVGVAARLAVNESFHLPPLQAPGEGSKSSEVRQCIVESQQGFEDFRSSYQTHVDKKPNYRGSRAWFRG